MTFPHHRTTSLALFSMLFIIIFMSFSRNSYSWSGYDFNEKTDIDIGQGNLVREGLIIEFYDSKTDSYHNAKVLLIEYESGGTMLKIEDLELNKIRTFVMRNS